MRPRTIGLTLIALAAIWGLAAMWWWALAGLSEPIGIATGFTTLALAMVGFLTILWEYA